MTRLSDRFALSSAALACAGLLAGCGTTVPLRDQAGLRSLDGLAGSDSSGSQGLPATGPSGPGATPGTLSPSSGSAQTGHPGSAQHPAGLRPSQPSGSSRIPDVRGRTVAPGAPVQVGLLNVTGLDSGLQALGMSGVAIGNMKAQGNALVSYLNARGGLGGHRILPVWFDYDVAKSGSGSYDTTLYEAACSHWTEDHHVFAAIWPGALASNVLPACMQKHQAGLIQLSVGGTTDRQLNSYSLVAAPVWISMERAYRVLIQRLAAQGYFKPSAIVGLVRFDTPDMAYVQKTVIEPELRRHGIKLAASVALKNPDSTSDISGSSAGVQGAIVKFRSAHVDHVIFEDFSRLAATLWLPQAQSAQYTPRYGLGSDSGPSYLVDNGNASMLAGAIGVGWNPSDEAGDTASSENPLRNNAAYARCMKIMAAGHQDMAEPGARESALQQCELMFVLQAIVVAGGEPSAAGVARGINALRDGPESGKTFGVRLLPGKHAGAAYVRDLYLDSACSCFRYRGPKHAVP